MLRRFDRRMNLRGPHLFGGSGGTKDLLSDEKKFIKKVPGEQVIREGIFYFPSGRFNG